MKRDFRIDAVAASDLVAASVLVGMLGAKGILSDEDVREVYEQAMYFREAHQGD
jgi:hypothetical protein